MTTASAIFLSEKSNYGPDIESEESATTARTFFSVYWGHERTNSVIKIPKYGLSSDHCNHQPCLRPSQGKKAVALRRKFTLNMTGCGVSCSCGSSCRLASSTALTSSPTDCDCFVEIAQDGNTFFLHLSRYVETNCFRLFAGLPIGFRGFSLWCLVPNCSELIRLSRTLRPVPPLAWFLSLFFGSGWAYSLTSLFLGCCFFPLFLEPTSCPVR